MLKFLTSPDTWPTKKMLFVSHQSHTLPVHGLFHSNWGWGYLSVVQHQTSMPLTQVWFPSAVRDFSLRVNFQCRLSYSVLTPPCKIACIYISAHIKYSLVRVRVWCIMETLKHPSCNVGWVTQLCRSWLSLGKATWISHGRNPIGAIQL